jgi:hypothetical protein
MECRLKARVRDLVEQLSRSVQQELAATGTLADLEELTCQIGDEFTRLLTEKELVRRSHAHSHQAAACPDCQRLCLPDHEPEPMVLKSLRGEVAFAQVKYFCDRCRRSFFPSGGRARPSAAKHRDYEGARESDLGRRQQRELLAGGSSTRAAQ